MTMRRCVSEPCLSWSQQRRLMMSAAAESGLKVYACYRDLRPNAARTLERLPPAMRAQLRDLGLCHYMTIFSSPEGELVQFDFGPVGGDIEKRLPLLSGSCGPEAGFASASSAHRPPGGPAPRQAVGGEIREETLADGLPPTAVLIGRTNLSIDDIRSYNRLLNQQYRLNENDCRHYVDAVVQYATGVERASARLMREQLVERARRRLQGGVEAGREGPLGRPMLASLSHNLAQLGQRALEKESTALIARLSQVSLAAAVATTGLRTVAPPLRHTPLGAFLPPIRAHHSAVPLVKATLTRAIPRLISGISSSLTNRVAVRAERVCAAPSPATQPGSLASLAHAATKKAPHALRAPAKAAALVSGLFSLAASGVNVRPSGARAAAAMAAAAGGLAARAQRHGDRAGRAPQDMEAGAAESLRCLTLGVRPMAKLGYGVKGYCVGVQRLERHPRQVLTMGSERCLTQLASYHCARA